MANGPRYKVPFRRRREGRTDYRQRARLLRARVPRAVVRISLRNVNIQIIEFDLKGDKVLVTAHSRELAEKGWDKATGNLPAAYLTGYLAGIRAKEKGITNAVLDIGLKVPSKGSGVFAALKGMVDAGLEIPHGEEVIPTNDRLMGKHIGDDVEKLVQDVKSRLEAD
ncbi:MAG: 50S ribosomal protein L18P [Methanomassiliicoccales archaeon PtaU1.Bin124]|nr:MAG: 50S ribosomal protein L18P [Methanomassiliicoccales archaeon PtaU1.Bin124]